MRYLDEQFQNKKESINSVITALFYLGNIKAIKRQEYIDDFVETTKKYNTEHHKSRFAGGVFDSGVLLVFTIYLNKKGVVPDTCNDVFIYDQLFKRLQSNRIIYEYEGHYFLNKAYFSRLQSYGLLENLLYGMSFTAEKYLPLIPAINVSEISTSDQYCGTGILISDRKDDGKDRHLVLTNRHVVEEGKYKIDSVTSSNIEFQILSDIYQSSDESIDLAAFEVSANVSGVKIHIGDDPQILDPIVSVGFPRIPYSDSQYALSHSGEVNGSISTLSGDKLLVISCNVNPGNSGGPILAKDGSCVGMVTQSLFEKDSESSPYNCAIPASTIKEFINEYRSS